MSDPAEYFKKFISEHDHGTTAELSGERMQRVTRAVLAHVGSSKAKGKVVLTLDIEKAGDGRAQITASIKSTEPQPGSASHTYFTDEEGNLHTQDPRQLSMPTRVLEPTPIRGGKA